MLNYNFAVVLYGLETWSFIEERTPRVLRNGVLPEMFGHKRKKVTGE